MLDARGMPINIGDVILQHAGRRIKLRQLTGDAGSHHYFLGDEFVVREGRLVASSRGQTKVSRFNIYRYAAESEI